MPEVEHKERAPAHQKTVFVSYAHADNESQDLDHRWLDRLIEHLRPLTAQGLLAIWSDRDIAMGDRWHDAIREQMFAAKVALLLLTPAFLASDYIRNYEMPVILQRALNKELVVISIIIRPCLFSTTTFKVEDPQTGGSQSISLAEFQAGNSLREPLNSLDQVKQDRILVAVAEQVQRILYHPNTETAATGVTPAREQKIQASADPNRNRLVKRVQKDWITGVLNHTLYAISPLNQELRDTPHSIQRAWDLVVHQKGEASTFHTTNEIATILDDFDEQLLILGDPGAGKTVLLLTLARHLLERASVYRNLRIPVVFNLSTWADRQQNLRDWLVDELNKRYDVRRRLAADWIDADMIFPLLDGLDEVAEDSRESCVRAMNAYRHEHPSMVVCSRTNDYDHLSLRLNLRGAVAIQRLTRDAVDRYLAEAGGSFRNVRQALQADPTLYELFDTPLMLSVAAVAFSGQWPTALTDIEDTGHRRDALFESYIDTVFHRIGRAKREKLRHYSKEQTLDWLSWLSSAMRRHNQAIVYLGWMQPSWLSSPIENAAYRTASAVLLGCVVGFASSLPVALLLLVTPDSPALGMYGLLGLALVAMVFGAFQGLLAGITSFMTHPLQGAASGALLILLVQGIFHFRFMSDSWALALMLGLAGISCWFATSVFGRPNTIVPHQAVSWSWRSLRQALPRRTIEGCSVGVVFGILAVWRNYVQAHSVAPTTVGVPLWELVIIILLCGGIGALIGAAAAVAFGGFGEADVLIRSEPNIETKRSGRMAAIWLLIASAPSVVALFLYSSGIAFVSRFWVTNRVGLGIFGYIWAICGIVVAGHFGGCAFLRHYALRLVLWATKKAPLSYVGFLNYAVELVLLRRVGGGYAFLHRMLLDYLAGERPPIQRDASFETSIRRVTEPRTK